MKPDISQTLDSQLEELRNTEDAKATRTQYSTVKKLLSPQNHNSCTLCKASGRPYTNTSWAIVYTYFKAVTSET